MAVLKILLTLLYLGATVNSMSLNDGYEENEQTTINKYRLPIDTVPIHYNVRINLHMAQRNSSFDGETTIDFEVRKSTSKIVLNSLNLDIDENRTSLETKDANVIKPSVHMYDNDTEMLHLILESPLDPGIYTLNLTFKGIMSSNLYGVFNGFYMDDQENETIMTGTHFQPMSARSAFPCWDEPALKATFNISIKHFDNYTALSNMPAYAQEIDGTDQKVWTHFETTPIMSTNILAFVVADYAHISNSDGTMKIWTRRNAIDDARYFMEIVETATERLTRYLNSTVGVPKMDHVTIPQYSARATENWGLIVYQDSALLHNNESHSTFQKVLNILTAVHELSHQWFGNLVSPAWWKYYWLSEGMATYLKYYITDKIFKDWRLMDAFVIDVQRMFLMDDRSHIAHVNKDFVTSWDMMTRDSSVIYRKSSIILRMLSYIVTEDVFRSGLLKYINKHKYSNVTSDDLWQAMQEAVDESSVSLGDVTLKNVMDTWIEQRGYPLVTVTKDHVTGTVTIRQEVCPSNGDQTERGWWIPITYARKSEPNFSSTVPTHWLQPNGKNVTIDGTDVNDWVIVNVKQSGYYRVNYDPANWRRIAKYLNSNDYLNIHPANRAQIIDDAFHSMLSKRLSPIIFMQLTNYLSRETDIIPWLSAFHIFSWMTEYFNHREGAAILKPHLLGLMNKFVESIGYEDHPGEIDIIKLKRMEALTWACKFEHPECRSKVAARLLAYVENPEANKISPDAKEWVYCAGLAKVNQSVWNKFLDSQRSEYPYKTLQYLRCSEDPAIIENYLDMAITNPSQILRPFDVFTSLSDDVPSNMEAELNFVTKNWDRITSVAPEADVIIEDLISKISSRDQLDKLKAFLKTRGINKDSQLHYRRMAIHKIEKLVAKIRVWLKHEYSGGEEERLP